MSLEDNYRSFERCVDFYGDETICLHSYGLEKLCDDGDDYCMCIDQMGYDFCKNYYGEEEDEDSCEGDVEYCQCVEAIGEEACAEYYG